MIPGRVAVDLLADKEPSCEPGVGVSATLLITDSLLTISGLNILNLRKRSILTCDLLDDRGFEKLY
jgi:hypothetical protein